MGDSSESSSTAPGGSSSSGSVAQDESSTYVTLDEIDAPAVTPTKVGASSTTPVAAVRPPIRDEDIKAKNFPPRAPSTSPTAVKTQPVTQKSVKQPEKAPTAQSSPAPVAPPSPNLSMKLSSRDVSIESFTSKRRTNADIEKSKSETTREFYSRQNGIIDLFEEVEKHSSPENAAALTQGLDDDDDRLPVKIAIRASFAVNVFLVFLKIFIAVRSNSMSVLASALDSILDIVSGSIMFVVDWLTQQQDKYSYPVGKKRLEPLGIIVFSTLMFTTALQILIEAFKRLSNHSTKINIEVYTLAGLIITIALKLLLYLYCRTVSGSSSVEALAQDHRNDVISNSVTIATALVAFYKPDLWYFDPIGGIAIGLYIMVVWVRTGFLTVRMMTGYVAPPDLIKKWTYLAMQHHPSVLAIDTVRGYHTSEGFVVELDIVLPEGMPLKEAHDIGEALQFKVEALEEVERCFVHLDYETDHKPEH